MTNFDRVIKKLVRLGRDRPDPEDHLYNITQCLVGIEWFAERELLDVVRYQQADHADHRYNVPAHCPIDIDQNNG